MTGSEESLMSTRNTEVFLSPFGCTERIDPEDFKQITDTTILEALRNALNYQVHAKKQIKELQRRNTELLMENRDLKRLMPSS